MSIFTSNLKLLRNRKGYTQEAMAKKLNIKRAVIGSYEEGRAEPKLDTLLNLARLFDVGIEELVQIDLEHIETKPDEKKGKDLEGKGLRVLTIAISDDGDEYITSVPIPASAGYLNGYADPEYIEELPRFKLPVVSKGRTSRIFQIKGDSMLPIKSGSYIIAEYLQDWHHLKDDEAYVLLTKEDGIVYKRIENHISQDKKLVLKSDNPEYAPYEVSIYDVLEIWKAKGFMSFDLPVLREAGPPDYTSAIQQMQRDIAGLKKNVRR